MAATNVKAPGVKISLLLILIIAGGVFAWTAYNRTSRGLAPSSPERAAHLQPGTGRGQTGERPADRAGGWVDPRTDPNFDREQRMAERMERLDLTPQQRAEMERLQAQLHADPSSSDRGAMYEAMRDVLTPEQLERWGPAGGQQSEQFRAEREARRAAREQEAREALSPQEFREWQAIREERRAANMAEGQGSGPRPGQGAGGGGGARASN